MQNKNSNNFSFAYKSEKKGISPIIASVLLIAIVIVIATIIFTWTRSSIIELGPIEQSCQNVNFNAGIYKENNEYYLDI